MRPRWRSSLSTESRPASRATARAGSAWPRSSSRAVSPWGLIALLADGLGADSEDVLFSGQSSIPTLVTEGSTTVVLVLLAAKALADAVSLAYGFRGGPIFPAAFLGIGLATLPVIWFDVSPTFAVAAGAAAGLAAQSRLLLTSMLFAALLVGTQGVDAVPAAVLAAAAAWLTVSALDRRRPLEEEGRS